jgi:leucyl-tRNA synthetase
VVLLPLLRSAQRVAPFDPGDRKQWTPVDQYIGGDSHAVMHLIYTRFWTKFMRDIGLVDFDEPVKRLLTQGMVTNRVEGTDEWKAMSKSLGNGVDPDEMIEAFGADARVCLSCFAAPVENELRWSESELKARSVSATRLHDGLALARATVKSDPGRRWSSVRSARVATQDAPDDREGHERLRQCT